MSATFKATSEKWREPVHRILSNGDFYASFPFNFPSTQYEVMRLRTLWIENEQFAEWFLTITTDSQLLHPSVPRKTYLFATPSRLAAFKIWIMYSFSRIRMITAGKFKQYYYQKYHSCRDSILLEKELKVEEIRPIHTDPTASFLIIYIKIPTVSDFLPLMLGLLMMLRIIWS